MNYLYSAAEAATLNEQQLGGKAANLLWLTSHGYPVPNWWVIPASAMDEMLRCDAKAAQLMAQLSPLMPADQIETLAGKISARLARLTLPEPLMQALEALSDEKLWAVRSSCSDEDARQASFAGQMDSFLFQRGLQQLVDAVKGVMMSTWSARAMAYRLPPGAGVKRNPLFGHYSGDGRRRGVRRPVYRAPGQRFAPNDAYLRRLGLRGGHCLRAVQHRRV